MGLRGAKDVGWGYWDSKLTKTILKIIITPTKSKRFFQTSTALFGSYVMCFTVMNGEEWDGKVDSGVGCCY